MRRRDQSECDGNRKPAELGQRFFAQGQRGFAGRDQRNRARLRRAGAAADDLVGVEDLLGLLALRRQCLVEGLGAAAGHLQLVGLDADPEAFAGRRGAGQLGDRDPLVADLALEGLVRRVDFEVLDRDGLLALLELEAALVGQGSKAVGRIHRAAADRKLDQPLFDVDAAGRDLEDADLRRRQLFHQALVEGDGRVAAFDRIGSGGREGSERQQRE